MRQRGTTLVEMLIAVAIVVLMAAAAFALSAGRRPYAMRSAVTQFDAAFAYAKALAATSGNGATMVFAPTSPGFTLTVYSGRPDGAGSPSAAALAPIVSSAPVAEATLGAPPFALFVNGAGHVSGRANYPSFTGGVPSFSRIASEPACPAGGYRLTFSDGSASDARTLACAGSGP